MAYTTIDNPELYFQAKLYTGNNTGQSITLDGSEDMSPNLIWNKSRSNTEEHNLWDSVRGTGKGLVANGTGNESAWSTGVTSFNSDGWTMGTLDSMNDGSVNFIAWCWKAGTSFTNDASATSIGSIDSAGSVSETAGFSICGYTGVSSAGTIKHGLSTTPSVIIWKNRTSSNGWITYHHRNTSAPETDYLELHSVNGTNDLNTIMNDTAPTSSVFSIGTEGAVGGSNTNNFISYIFSERQGFSKFGRYQGNSSSNGVYIHTGFRPAFLIVHASENTSGSNNWFMADNKNHSVDAGTGKNFNPIDRQLYSNLNNAADTNADVDFFANGFKFNRDGGDINYTGRTFVYFAWAEAPFVNSNGVPCNAR